MSSTVGSAVTYNGVILDTIDREFQINAFLIAFSTAVERSRASDVAEAHLHVVCYILNYVDFYKLLTYFKLGRTWS